MIRNCRPETEGYFDVCAHYGQRIERAKERLRLTWRGENRDRPAFILSDVNYALCGQSDIPENYFEPEVMFAYQRDKIRLHMKEIEDDYVPVFHPWYGTTVVPSALGGRVRYQKGMDPAAEGAVLSCPLDIGRLRMPDPYADGDMPRVLRCIDYFRSHTSAPVCVTDCQGPFNIALTLAGAQTLFVWMYEHPAVVHELMEFCTEVLIRWIKTQKRHAKQALCSGAYPHAIYLPEGYGGVAFSDDDIVAVSAEHYKQFVLPYNERILAEFGGGTLHFCGSAHHQLDNLSDMSSCTGVNNFTLGDKEQLRQLQWRFHRRGAVMACDFNAMDIKAHCDSLRATLLNPSGVVCGVFVTPTMVLENGKYRVAALTRDDIVSQYMEGLSNWLNT